MNITIGSSSSSYRSGSGHGYSARSGLTRDAAGSCGSSAAGPETELSTDAVVLYGFDDGGERQHACRSATYSHGGFGGDNSGLKQMAVGESRSPPSLSEGKPPHRPPPPNASAARSPQRQVIGELVHASPSGESMSRMRMAPPPDGASRPAAKRDRASGGAGARGPQASPLGGHARAGEPTAVAGAALATRWPGVRGQLISRDLAGTASPSPLRGKEAADYLRCGPLGMLALGSLSDYVQGAFDDRPRRERVLPPARVKSHTAAMPSPAPDSVLSASLSHAVGRCASPSEAGVTAAAFSDSYGGGEARRHHYSGRRRTDSGRRAADDDEGATSGSHGATETNGARPPVPATAPSHPSLFVTQARQHTCRRPRSSSDSTKERHFREAQRGDGTRQALNASQASSPALCPVAARCPAVRALPSVPLPRQGTVGETGGNRGTSEDESGAVRNRWRGTGPVMTELAEPRLPLATPTEGAVRCGGSGGGGAAAVAVESPPPLPPAAWRVGGGACCFDPSRCRSHRHSMSSAADAHGVALQAASTEADVARKTRALVSPARGFGEREEPPSALSLRDGAARALEVDGARRGAAPSPQRRARDLRRREVCVACGATGETAVPSSPLPVVTHSPRRPAAQEGTECDSGHSPPSRRGAGRTAESPFKGGVNFARWVPSCVGGEADLSGASLAPPPVPSTSTTSASGTVGNAGGREAPRVVAVPLVALPHRTPPREAVAPAVLAEVAQGCASAALEPGAKRVGAEACRGAAAWSRPRVRLTVVASMEQELTAGEGFLASSGGARRAGIAAVLEHAHAPHSISNARHVQPAEGAVVSALGAAAMKSCATMAELDGAEDDREVQRAARPWRPGTLLNSVRHDVCQRSTLHDCECRWCADAASRCVQKPQSPRATQRSAATCPHNDSRDRAAPMEVVLLASCVPLALEACADVGGSAHQVRSAATRRAGAASDGVAGGLLSSSSLTPGYAAVCGPRMIATRVLEAREALLGTIGAAAAATATDVYPSGPPGAPSPHGGSRAMPAVGAAVAAAASTIGGVPSRSLSSLPSPPRARVVLTERSTNAGVMPAVTAEAAPRGLCLSGSPDAEGSRRHRTALLQQPARGRRHLHRQDLPVGTPPCPVARRIPFGFAAGSLGRSACAQAVPSSPDGRMRGCHPRAASPAAGASAPVPGAHCQAEGCHQRARRRLDHAAAEGRRSATAWVHISPIVARAAAASVAAPLERTSTPLDLTATASPAPRATSVGTAQDRHGGILSPEHRAVIRAAGAGERARERVRSTSTGRSGTGATDAGQSHGAHASREMRQPQVLARQRLIQEEAFRRRHICMQEDHRIAMEVTELNYKRAVEYVRQASAAGAVVEPLVGLQRVRRAQAAVTATLSMLAKEVAALSP
ncbi:hypothetical protein LSCM4_01827 [Leishmania orientalis]|uniref:5'a2rel-related protein n=1 Tax=Leishmania orientalis TaxID=2249476 RepID=A0A836HD52_9TRYP|nr:hypothetical protein LSCM4_01827 [Leishmania orientalis]